MRLLHTADVHLGKATHGKIVGGRSSRLDDFAATLERFATTAIEREVGLAVIAGDLFDTRRPGPSEIAAAVRPIRRLSAHKIRTVIVPGNHDGMGTIADPDSHTLGWMADLDMPFVHVFTKPRVGVVGVGGSEIMLVSVPYPHKRAYDSILPEAGPEERVEAISRDVSNTIAEMLHEAAQTSLPVVFVGHLTVMGGMAGPERMMRMGWDVTIGPEAFEHADYAALGHLHPQQQVAENAWYAGSPDYHDFGDVGPKGFLLVDLAVAEHRVESIPSNPRPMIVVDLHEDFGWGPTTPPDMKDATVLLRFHPTTSPRVPADVLASTRRAVYTAGAFHVKDVTVPPESATRARVEINPEVEILDAVEQWALANGVDPERILPVARELHQSFGG